MHRHTDTQTHRIEDWPKMDWAKKDWPKSAITPAPAQPHISGVSWKWPDQSRFNVATLRFEHEDQGSQQNSCSTRLYRHHFMPTLLTTHTHHRGTVPLNLRLHNSEKLTVECDLPQHPLLTTSASSTTSATRHKGGLRRTPLEHGATVMANFGQTDFGNRLWPKRILAQTDFGQTGEFVCLCVAWVLVSRFHRARDNSRSPPFPRTGLPLDHPRRNPLFVEFWWCLKRWGAQMCTGSLVVV